MVATGNRVTHVPSLCILWNPLIHAICDNTVVMSVHVYVCVCVSQLVQKPGE